MNATLTDRGVGKTTLTVTDTAAAQARAVDTAALASAVPPELASILTEVMRIVAAGGTVTLGSIPDELTTTNAADMLDISRPVLMKLIRCGDIPAHKVGSRTRLRAGDVLAYRERMREQQRAAFRELRAFEDDESLDY
ncbi:DNA-binding protein [Rhodococcus sp. ACPA4]|uniref:helix-turn-helix domain-containing protein n=1 Tax=Rhodococcus sp. ACPA4 TaxID=2028571 RepID=UPI000BB127BF|nr:helix-turn-helix domain-containing protein [Rhodococcus sp. ACPA4]PBC35923.1 DNA-binding protein [Rhodococcus sp. ACPA4]